MNFRFTNMAHSAKKAKTLKDQDAPKRPLNAYMMFCSKEREKVQEEINSLRLWKEAALMKMKENIGDHQSD